MFMLVHSALIMFTDTTFKLKNNISVNAKLTLTKINAVQVLFMVSPSMSTNANKLNVVVKW